MQRLLLATLTGLAVAACAYRPTPTETIRIVDSPTSVRSCTRLGEVSPTVPTTPGFDAALEGMLRATVALGGTDLYLQRRSTDWSLVHGIAYLCDGVRVRQQTVIRAKG
jgi:hypothetical protein